MQLHIEKDPSELSKVLAQWTADYISSTLKIQDRFTWVITGGNSPKQLYDLLSQSPLKEKIDWTRMHIFWGDERAVPFADDRNNAKMCFEHLLNKVPIPREQIHVMNTDIDPKESASQYEKILRGYFVDDGSSFDLVLSGMGDDAHTLSLFPHTAAIHEKNLWATSLFLKSQDMFRITLTAPIVNRAKKISFLTFGKAKADALKHVLEDAYNPDLYPSQIIKPVSGELHWFVDQEAASLLAP
ncbi:MAG: 6-phosphogluconolactonase [Bacteroidetes bacterium]|nr:MAG: 6-phosphogluconolactonase [Bacteroidota bacterium]